MHINIEGFRPFMVDLVHILSPLANIVLQALQDDQSSNRTKPRTNLMSCIECKRIASALDPTNYRQPYSDNDQNLEYESGTNLKRHHSHWSQCGHVSVRAFPLLRAILSVDVLGAPMVRQDNIFPPSICKENSGKKYACMCSELVPVIGALLLPIMHIYYQRPLADNVLQASSFEPQVFTHASPCRFYLPLFLAGVRSANVVNIWPSERMSGFSHSAATRLSIRDWYCPLFTR